MDAVTGALALAAFFLALGYIAGRAHAEIRRRGEEEFQLTPLGHAVAEAIRSEDRSGCLCPGCSELASAGRGGEQGHLFCYACETYGCRSDQERCNRD